MKSLRKLLTGLLFTQLCYAEPFKRHGLVSNTPVECSYTHDQPTPDLICNEQGRILAKIGGIIEQTNSWEFCIRACQYVAASYPDSCVSFAYNQTSRYCTLYPAPLRSLGFRFDSTSDSTMAHRECYSTLNCTAFDYPEAFQDSCTNRANETYTPSAFTLRVAPSNHNLSGYSLRVGRDLPLRNNVAFFTRAQEPTLFQISSEFGSGAFPGNLRDWPDGWLRAAEGRTPGRYRGTPWRALAFPAPAEDYERDLVCARHSSRLVCERADQTPVAFFVCDDLRQPLLVDSEVPRDCEEVVLWAYPYCSRFA